MQNVRSAAGRLDFPFAVQVWKKLPANLQVPTQYASGADTVYSQYAELVPGQVRATVVHYIKKKWKRLLPPQRKRIRIYELVRISTDFSDSPKTTNIRINTVIHEYITYGFAWYSQAWCGL